MVPLPKKRCQSTLLSRKFEFAAHKIAITYSNLSYLILFVGNETKVFWYQATFTITLFLITLGFTIYLRWWYGWTSWLPSVLYCNLRDSSKVIYLPIYIFHKKEDVFQLIDFYYSQLQLSYQPKCNRFNKWVISKFSIKKKILIILLTFNFF